METKDQNGIGKNPDTGNQFRKLTPMELNNIKLDVRHTILTPDYLDKIAEDNQQQANV